ncbi:hypothetical protein BGZ58_003932 [Dissophora ornata]|nr:hypothetical protein BGZ58_003932 [Dissophora ornata]
MIPSRVNKHIQLEYVIFARGAYLDESDGHMKGETIAKESYGVEGPVSKLWTLPAIQPLIDEQLQDMYCRGHDCGIKLSKENAIYDRSSSMDHYPFIGIVSVLLSSQLRFFKSSFKWHLISGNYAFGVAPNSAMNVVPILESGSQLIEQRLFLGSRCRMGTQIKSCIFSDRDILERIEYLDQLAKEMPAGVVWGDMVLDKIENFDEELERNRPDVDPYLRKSYDTFLRHRINKGKEHRIQHWTFEKYRFYLEVCERQSVVSGMKPRKCCDFDRCINTDPYDLHTVVYMEREINFMKQDFLEFQNDDEFKRSKEKSRTRWAVNVLPKHLFKLIDDTNELKLG